MSKLLHPHTRYLINHARVFSCDDPVEEAVMYWAGPRCPDYEPECAACKTWAAYDKLIASAHNAREMMMAFERRRNAALPHNLGDDDG